MPQFVKPDTTNFLKLYAYVAGDTNVPQQFHLWGGMAVMAAAASNRVSIEIRRGHPIYPNVYVMLVGESGTGKNAACDLAQDILGPSASWALPKNFSIEYAEPLVYMWRGKTTAPNLIDLLDKQANVNQKDSAALTLFTPELLASVGDKQWSEQLLALLTEMYSGGAFMDGTRTSGQRYCPPSCITWLAGSTPAWLAKSFSRDALLGGASARFVVVYADPPRKIKHEYYPPDVTGVTRYLQDRAYALTQMSGQYRMTEMAEITFAEWVENREYQEDALLRPWWMREHVTLLKLAMLLHLSEGSNRLVLTHNHIDRAAVITESLRDSAASLVVDNSEQPPPVMTSHINVVEHQIKKRRKVDHSTLLRLCRNKGFDAAKVGQAVSQLLLERKVEIERTETGGREYKWVG